jgi:hypothetical protein
MWCFRGPDLGESVPLSVGSVDYLSFDTLSRGFRQNRSGLRVSVKTRKYSSNGRSGQTRFHLLSGHTCMIFCQAVRDLSDKGPIGRPAPIAVSQSIVCHTKPGRYPKVSLHICYISDHLLNNLITPRDWSRRLIATLEDMTRNIRGVGRLKSSVPNCVLLAPLLSCRRISTPWGPAQRLAMFQASHRAS